MLPSPVARSPVIDKLGVTFGLDDRYGRLRTVRLVQEIGLLGPLDLARSPRHWRLRLPIPAVDRMEYLYEIEDHNGNRTTITDPGNPRRVGGAFGDKSEVRFPGYQQPEWLAWPEIEPAEVPLELAAGPLETGITGILWSPCSLPNQQPAPLVVVHDGPEYATLGSFTRYLGTAMAVGALPPLRAVLLGPADRNLEYSANPSYPRRLGYAIRAALDPFAPTTIRLGVGVSLGALAMLHAHRSLPGLFDALLLQSGSFFTPRLDPQERDFSGFGAVSDFVAEVHSAASDDHPVPTVLTCGTAEENLANNQRMAATLRRLGYPVQMVEGRDAHNFTAWRDALHPHLATMVSNLVADRAA